MTHLNKRAWGVALPPTTHSGSGRLRADDAEHDHKCRSVRVIDGSIMKRVPSVHTLATIVIAEQAAHVAD
jgi:hypothetical protein